MLLVGADPSTRGATTDLFRNLGHSVMRTGAERDATALFESGANVALLLTDAASGNGGSGHVLVLRAQERRPDLRVLMATDRAEEAASTRPEHAREAFGPDGPPRKNDPEHQPGVHCLTAMLVGTATRRPGKP